MEQFIAYTLFIASLIIFAMCAIAGFIHDRFGDL